jgi:peptide/nickel transport system substrate-binding protein
MKRFTRGPALVAAAAMLALAGCSAGGGGGDDAAGGGGGGSNEAAGGGTLTLGVVVPASSFAAQDARWANEAPYMQAVYDTLLRATPDGEVEPHLATAWEYNDDSTVLTLTLRDDVTFTDGEKLTADAAAQNLLRFKAGASPNASDLTNLQDARAIDGTTLEITLSQPDPAMLNYLTKNSGLVESPAAFDSPDAETVPVGSGPYVLNTDETVVGSSYVFDTNPDYWNPDDQHYDRLLLNVFTDPTSLINAIQGGQVNGANIADFTTLPTAEAAGFTVNQLELDWAGLLLSDREGTLTPALGDVRVRQAINHALDRDAMLEALIGGNGSTTTQVFPTFSESYDESLDDAYEYDVDRAEELMAEAGYPDGFTLRMPQTSLLPASNFTLVADQLADIDITVEFENLQVSDYIGNILGGRFSASIFQLQQDATDWQLAQFQIGASSTWNTFHVADPTVEGLIAELQTGDEATAREAGQELNRYLVENAWFAPFYRPRTSFVTDPDTKATMQTGNAYPYLWNIVPA